MGFVNSKRYDGVQLYHKANKDISYYVRYKDENNKLVRVKIGDKSKGITEPYCYKKRSEILNHIRLGEDSPLASKKKKVVTLNDIADIYFKQRESHAKDNVKSYQKYSTKLKTKFGDEDIEKITSDRILDYQIELRKSGLAPATINYTMSFLGTLFSIAIEEEIYTKLNPVKSKKIKKLKVDNQRERYLTKQEIKTFYNKLDDETLRLFVDLSLSTGGRLETILNIKVKDINIENKIITLKDLKNDSTYRGFISTDLTKYLQKYIKGLSANTFVIGAKNTKIPTRTISRKIKKIMDDLFNQGLDTKSLPLSGANFAYLKVILISLWFINF